MQNNPQQYDAEYNRNLITTFILVCVLMGAWFYFYELPQRRALYAQKQKAQIEAAQKQKETPGLAATAPEIAKPKPREEVISNAPRIKLDTPNLHGSINLKGARLDDITLAKYKQTMAKNSPEVVLLSPPGTDDTSFIETGWVAADKNIKVPDADSVWKLSGNSTLSPGNPVTLEWDNSQGFNFITKYSVDENYMFTIEQKIENKSAAKASFYPYGLISKSSVKLAKQPAPVIHILSA